MALTGQKFKNILFWVDKEKNILIPHQLSRRPPLYQMTGPLAKLAENVNKKTHVAQNLKNKNTTNMQMTDKMAAINTVKNNKIQT